jgi:hypothetical protein
MRIRGLIQTGRGILEFASSSQSSNRWVYDSRYACHGDKHRKSKVVIAGTIGNHADGAACWHDARPEPMPRVRISYATAAESTARTDLGPIGTIAGTAEPGHCVPLDK